MGQMRRAVQPPRCPREAAARWSYRPASSLTKTAILPLLRCNRCPSTVTWGRSDLTQQQQAPQDSRRRLQAGQPLLSAEGSSYVISVGALGSASIRPMWRHMRVMHSQPTKAPGMRTPVCLPICLTGGRARPGRSIGVHMYRMRPVPSPPRLEHAHPYPSAAAAAVDWPTQEGLMCDSPAKKKRFSVIMHTALMTDLVSVRLRVACGCVCKVATRRKW